MSELLPCPFCGGGAQTLRNGSWWCVACRTPFCCDVGKFDTEAEAIEAWNTRSERTCHIVEGSRKIVLSDETELFENGCSECNGYLDDFDSYCANCGARVTPKNSETTPKVVEE